MFKGKGAAPTGAPRSTVATIWRLLPGGVSCLAHGFEVHHGGTLATPGDGTQEPPYRVVHRARPFGVPLRRERREHARKPPYRLAPSVRCVLASVAGTFGRLDSVGIRFYAGPFVRVIRAKIYVNHSK